MDTKSDEWRRKHNLPTVSEELAVPDGLSADGTKAAKAILDFLNLRREGLGIETGGCRTFYTPEEWKKRNEKYGRDSVLIVVYDGGDVRPYFSLDAECYKMHDAMGKALQEAGFYAEECTGWYSAIYPRNR